MPHACHGCLSDTEGHGVTCSCVLGCALRHDGSAPCCHDDDATLLWWGHIRTMVSLVIFVMSGRSGRWGRASRSGLFSMVGGYGDSILPVARIPPSSF